jgi:AraC-like DNA-binding protein
VLSSGEKFILQAVKITELKMNDPQFSVEDLSSELFISRVVLYRKLLTLTGKTPIEFIRSLRMKKAAQLLEKSAMNISEVAYEVGYNNPKQFTKYFKEAYGATPSVYAAGKK